jgi:TRAP transporter 4TM/12TM fusion protein
MAQVLGIPYSDVAIAAIIPAALYFYMCFVVVHLQAVKSGMRAYSASELPRFRDVMAEGWHVIITLAALFYMLLGMKLTPNKTALYCCGVSVLLSWFSKNDKMTLKVIIRTLKEAAEDVVSVALACGTAGIIIGVLGLTGLGLKLSSLLVLWSGGNLIILMVLTMITGFVLGMGLPTTGVYIILSVLAAPALVNMGVGPLSAHFFVFYYGVLAAITPPVALASYAGAGIAGANYMKTGWEAVKLGSAGFLVPFIFVFAPAILMQGSASEIAHVTFTAFLGVTALSMSLQGYPAKGLLSRVLLGISALLLLDPGLMTDIAGAVLVAGVLIADRVLKKREAKVTVEE